METDMHMKKRLKSFSRARRAGRRGMAAVEAVMLTAIASLGAVALYFICSRLLRWAAFAITRMLAS